ncbi:putative HTH-type transcriptional regulator (plasmid) [Nitrosomonas stercoris]|uniref:Putative HTH-type transcriptional regulator n=1 Tax=Nitrosomonas stercoris TaxID=1444684 RepID=A0A4Y1YRY9_9PROT|nr:putative HTH-type transcriptional regulator [Nitrosomonas stercoris]
MDMMNHPHPGMILREDVLKALDMTVGEAAKRLGMSRESISRVVNGRSAISYDLAIRLEAAGVSTARFWTALQCEYDLEKAREGAQDAELLKIVPLVPKHELKQV